MVIVKNINGTPTNEDGTPYIRDIKVLKFGSHSDNDNFYFWENKDEWRQYKIEHNISEPIFE